MITNYPILTRLGVAFIDALVTIISFILASYVRNTVRYFYDFGGITDWHDYWIWLIIIILLWRGLLGYQEAYVGQRFTSLKSDILTVFKTVLLGTIILLTIAFFIKSNIPRTFIISFAIVNLFLLILEKSLLHRIISYVRKKGKNRKTVFVVGAGDVAKQFIESVNHYSDWGLNILGIICFHETDLGKELLGYKLLDTVDNMWEYMNNNQVDEVIIALPAKYLGNAEKVIDICDQIGKPVRIVSPFFKNLISKAKTDTIHGLPVIKFTSLERNEFEAALKRLFDIVISLISLLILSPAFAVIALLIKLDSKGPVFYPWRVVGQNNRDFVGYKFRTMIVDADNLKASLTSRNEMEGPVFKIKDDPRITRVGKWLRKYSLDELPQLWSVLKGDMSLVGPRPPSRNEIDRFEFWQRRKISCRPGMTCLWQVNGRNEIRSFDDWCRLDLEYIDNWNLWLDVKILVRTAWVVIRGTGV
ncbi:MAG: sugar transferase [Deltaproteobacteria bacterium]|nr:sugar transferase [Deltaproteobacteria bacterium]